MTVNDSNGFPATSGASVLNVTAAAASSTSTILGLPPLAFYGLIALVVVVAWVGAVLWMYRRRASPRSTAPGPGAGRPPTSPRSPP